MSHQNRLKLVFRAEQLVEKKRAESLLTLLYIA
jgi:hypothetical protein